MLMKNKPVAGVETVYRSIKLILEEARAKSFRAVNSAMVNAY